MSNLRKALDTQQKVQDAVKRITDYFGEMNYLVHVEQMLNAQTQIIGMMELVKMQVMHDSLSEGDYETNEIVLFLKDVANYLRMLKPFAELAGNMYEGEGRE